MYTINISRNCQAKTMSIFYHYHETMPPFSKEGRGDFTRIQRTGPVKGFQWSFRWLDTSVSSRFLHFVPQHPPQNLTYRGGWQGFPEFDEFGAFVSSQLVLAECHDFRLGYGFSG